VIIDRDALRGILAALPFETGRWVVAGSAPMLMAGLIQSIRDIDIVVDPATWRQAVSLSEQAPRGGLYGDCVVELDVAGAPVEVFDGWLGIEADTMIAEAVDVEGVPCSPLGRVLDSKRRLLRNKDLAHIELLDGLLTDGPTADSPCPASD
jgi:hypothetical protein